ncbi:MAG: DMT family transporter [Rhodospirillaceae bacterium]|jgi:drug/metabolite transporter (DMT)-like permease|nr:DMT family transporter [Rhodospirillaceae bacterium]MBT5526306.1 DMT family transporter [Rhodospirillaceae bacterium]MBT5881546.1 DMT family transporter [Rhodospirillaceae bacterium]MBT6587504.1 DMT family transporter [Rhodospirillaceae bacterium]MBT6911807.1 DMT family transporter [Rhodospirillaceae bacterium]
MPAVLAVLWSTGFIGVKFGLPYAEPATFLAYRCTLVAAILILVAAITRAPWPKSPAAYLHLIVAGLLLQAVNLGCVFFAIDQGVDASVTALINGLQPVLVAIIAVSVLGERSSIGQWLGFGLGLGGVAMVVWRKLELGVGTPLGMSLSICALLGLSIGVIYQKKFCDEMDLRTGMAVQTAAAAIAMWFVSSWLETGAIDWTGEFIFAFVWLSVVLSLGAITLLLYLIRRGQAARVSSLFFLVPPAAAVFSYFMFDETFGPIALIGMIVSVIGVAFVNRFS